MRQAFDMKDLRPVDVILGIKALERGREFVLTQSHYIEKTLRKFNRFDCQPCKTHPHVKLVQNEGTAIIKENMPRLLEASCML